MADISWHGCRLYSPGWNDPTSRVLAFSMGGFAEVDSTEDVDIHVMLNMEWEDLDFELPPITSDKGGVAETSRSGFQVPPIEGRQWYRVVDTALPSPDDIVTPEEAPAISGNTYHVNNRSVVVLISR